MAKYKSILYSRIVPSDEAPSIIKWMIRYRVARNYWQANIFTIFLAILGFVLAGFIFTSNMSGSSLADVYDFWGLETGQEVGQTMQK